MDAAFAAEVEKLVQLALASATAPTNARRQALRDAIARALRETREAEERARKGFIMV